MQASKPCGIAENGRERQARSVKSNSDYAPSRRATDELDSAQLEREEHTRLRVRGGEPAPRTNKVSHQTCKHQSKRNCGKNGRERPARSVKSNSDHAPSTRANNESGSEQHEGEEHTRLRVRRREPAPLTSRARRQTSKMSNRQKRDTAVSKEIFEGRAKYDIIIGELSP